MDIPVGNMEEIVALALEIKEAADTVRRNKEECLEIVTRVSRLSAILSALAATETMQELATRTTLQELGGTLRRAHSLVKACQEKETVFNLFETKNLPKQLIQVNDKISSQMMGVISATNAKIPIMLTTTRQGEVRPALLQDPGQVENSPKGFRIFTLSELDAATNNFSEESIIGKGRFSTAYKGVLSDKSVVAIKRFRDPWEAPHLVDDYLSFHSELGEHPNCVKLLGYCHGDRRGESNMLVVEECMPNGNLSKIIDGSSQPVDWALRSRIIRGIAQGLADLGTKNIMHLDLKPSNILFDSDMNPKISDCGLSRLLRLADNDEGELSCVPPEYLMQGVISNKYDVYSFGILLLGTISGMRTSQARQDSVVDWASEALKAGGIKELFDPSTCDKSQLNQIKRYMKIGLLCTQMNRKYRPTLPDVLEMLDGNKKLPTIKRGKGRGSEDVPTSWTKYSLFELQYATNEFSEENVIGKGGFATLYKGFLSNVSEDVHNSLNGKWVGIKRFQDSRGPQNLKRHARVFSVLRKHENVVRFLGYCQEDGQEMFVEEYMPNGSFSEIIDGSSQQLDWSSVYHIVRRIAKDVAHLHTKNVVHLDLKPDNILLDSDMNPKISGFEISKILDSEVIETSTQELMGTVGYRPPEYIKQGFVSNKYDVYSFGVLLLCTIGGMSRHGLLKDPIHWAWEVQEAEGMKEIFDLSSFDASKLKEIKMCLEIGLLCTQMERKDRPTMSNVVRMLKGKRKLPTPKRNKDAARGEDTLISLFSTTDITIFSFSEMEAATNKFSEQNVTERGGFATVYKGVLSDQRRVAIKKFHDPWAWQALSQYVHVFSVLLQHNNVVGLLGYCPEKGQEMVVEEYMPNGSLSKIIDVSAVSAGPSHQLEWQTRFRIIQGVAEGVAHLHAYNTYHLDLKPSNILFNSDMNPKISNFGLSRRLGQAETMTPELAGALDYMPPEYLTDGLVSNKYDVYSFGVLLLCTVSGMGKSGLREDSVVAWAWEEHEAGGMNKLFHPSLVDESQLDEIKRCMEIGLLCTQKERRDRPTMPDVLKMLQGKRQLPTLKRNKDAAGSEDALISPSMTDFTKFGFSELETATNNFSKDNVIEELGFATIYKGVLLDKRAVVVKRFHNPWGSQGVMQYVRVLSVQLQHKNVIGFLGYCSEDGREMVVEEYIQETSLSKFIDVPAGQSQQLEWRSRFQIIRGIAQRVADLHAERIVHLDLTPANILLDSDKNPKICSSTLSKRLDEEDTETVTNEAAGTVFYMAPEYILGGHISVKNDVYSFGIILRIISGTSTFRPPQDLHDLVTVVREARRMKNLYDPTKCDEPQLKQIKRCMQIEQLCTQYYCHQRPTMQEVLKMLEEDM